ncbi:MAG: TonB-dependent receptor [Rhodoferax sp.]|nr:TonB-dependent receptor [Rhodoferax sp.]
MAQSAATLKEVVVTASRVAQPVTDVVADVSIIDRSEIERLGVSTVGQLLATLPGVQSVASGESVSVYLRGTEARMTALYVDGVRVDSQDGLRLGGGVPWEMIALNLIDRVEVLRGPASAVYGSDAMGGVIQIFTRRGEAGFTPYVNLGMGSLNQKTVDAGFSAVQGGLDYALTFGREQSDGFDTRPDLVHTPDHEASARQSSSVRLGYRLSPAHRLEVTALNSQLDSQYVPWGGGANIKVQSDLTTASLGWQAQWTDTYRTRLSLSQSRSAKRDSAPNDFQTNLKTALFENNLRLGAGTVTAVLEQRQDDFKAEASAWDPAFSGVRTQHAVALGYGANYGKHAVQVNVRQDNDSLFTSKQTGGLAYGYTLAPNWRVNVSTGTAFRVPTLEQVYGPYGDPQLAPESNQNHELGLRYSTPLRSFNAVLYRNDISNMISSSQTLTTCSAGFFCYYNVGQASIQGVTLSGTQRMGPYHMRAALDLLDPSNAITGKTLSLRARKTLTVGVERPVAGWHLGAELRAVGERFDNAANTIVLPGYALLSLSASTQLAKDWRLVVRLDNTSDTQYQPVGQFANPGRRFYTALQWQPQ